MFLKPDFLGIQPFIGRGHASIVSSGRIVWVKRQSVYSPTSLSGRNLRQLSTTRKVYMPSLNKLVTRCPLPAVALALAFAFAVPAALPQQPVPQQPVPPPQDQEPQRGGVINTEVGLVNFFATVRDKNKRLIPDLKQEDFKILEDAQEQKIAFFSKETALPITLALLLDTSGSEQYMIGAIQEMGGSFLTRILRKGDEAMVMSFDSDVDLLSDFTDDRRQLDRAVHRARVNIPGGGSIAGNPGPIGGQNVTGTALYDAIYLACHEKLNTEAGRKAIVIVTDADDQGSKVKIDEAIEAAQRTNTVIHILLVWDPHFGANTSAANKLAGETGGRVISANSEKKLSQAFDEITQELRTQYNLGYYSSNLTRDGKFRKVKVETADHDLKVLARKGYYAPSGAPESN